MDALCGFFCCTVVQTVCGCRLLVTLPHGLVGLFFECCVRVGWRGASWVFLLVYSCTGRCAATVRATARRLWSTDGRPDGCSPLCRAATVRAAARRLLSTDGPQTRPLPGVPPRPPSPGCHRPRTPPVPPPPAPPLLPGQRPACVRRPAPHPSQPAYAVSPAMRATPPAPASRPGQRAAARLPPGRHPAATRLPPGRPPRYRRVRRTAAARPRPAMQHRGHW